MNFSYVAVLTNDRYFPGLCALSYSLKKVNSRYPLSVVIPHNMPLKTKQLITDIGIPMIEMNDIPLEDALLEQNTLKRWNPTLFKLNIFNLSQFDKIVFLDLDMIVVKNIDELFFLPHMSSVAAGNCIYKDWTRLNSGLIVIEPDRNIFDGIISCCAEACEDRIRSGLGFGDQDVINFFYHDWSNHSELTLSETYNCMSFCIKKLSSLYGYDNLKVLHFADNIKPWQHSRKSYCVYLAKRVIKGEWGVIKAFFTYRKYLKESCPNYAKFL